MTFDEYACDKCGAKFGIFGESTGSDDDLAADMHYNEQVEWHQSGACTATEAATPAAPCTHTTVSAEHLEQCCRPEDHPLYPLLTDVYDFTPEQAASAVATIDPDDIEPGTEGAVAERLADALQRAEYVSGLRAIADILDANPALPLPYPGASDYAPFSWYVTSGKEQKATAAAIVRAIGGRWDKDATHPNLFVISTRLRGLLVDVTADRDQVCTRRIVGSQTVIKKIPTAFEEREIKQDIIEWDCGSLLAGAS